MIETFPTPAALAEAATTAVHGALISAIDHRGGASLVATGGRSPAPIYDRLARSRLDWGRVAVTLSDDRFTPATSADSNERLVREHLLTGAAAAAAARFVPLWRPADSPQAAADLAEADVAALGSFDMLLLGMGEDGHVASLIPGSPVLEAGMDPGGDRLLLGVPEGVGSPPVARITMTLPALLRARATLILISGAAKRAIVEDAAGLPVHALLEQAKAPVRILWTM
ncbi:6-phosphogluconolactonase [Phenylobacterium sp.]|uniref:6-phosphogluconolactonase n=1 Tax=Phenylobacterium sp. TaxID=1871053 RepID=UPI002734E344|nr:6-phosphogluconolactonase [Phenylobacterium sp.]MDP3853403.1 6-phosphogluconolactonase [Phenylobacterium sp.]